ncbi:MAG: hypothetical protein HRT36_07030 [Alphaproteobacteria bacterium]|nr:hypothetical protein [Alphaproteobacteria bacterium]
MTGEMLDGDVVVCGEYIVGVGANYEVGEVIDVSGLILVPAPVDAPPAR